MDCLVSGLLLKGEKKQGQRSEFYYWTRGVLHAARSGNWKLHTLQREPVNYGKQVELDSPELYHLQYDISEKHDVADQHPEIVEEILRKMDAHRKEALANALPDNLVARIKE